MSNVNDIVSLSAVNRYNYGRHCPPVRARSGSSSRGGSSSSRGGGGGGGGEMNIVEYRGNVSKYNPNEPISVSSADQLLL